MSKEKEAPEAPRIHKEDRDDREYQILEEQKNRNQNRRDAVIAAVSTVGVGFCADNAMKLSNHPFYGWGYLVAALVFVTAIYFVVLSCNECEKAIKKRQNELGAKYQSKSVFNDNAFLAFTMALGIVVFAFLVNFIHTYWRNFCDI